MEENKKQSKSEKSRREERQGWKGEKASGEERGIKRGREGRM